jgi:hypothetical protein
MSEIVPTEVNDGHIGSEHIDVSRTLTINLFSKMD